MEKVKFKGTLNNFYTKNLKFMTLFLVIILLCIVFSLSSPYFLTVDNITTVLRQVSVLGVVAVGQTIIFLIGGVDISVGANAAMTGCLTAFLMTKTGIHPVLCLLLGMLLGLFIGFVNGLIVTKLRIIPLVGTLGMSSVLRGSAYVLTGGVPFYGLPQDYSWIASGYLFEFIPVPVIIMAIIFILGAIFLEKTYIGRRIYALGGNPEATRLTGVNINSLTISSFTICGLLASIGGIMLMFRINSGQPQAAMEYDLNSITSVALGGISMSGGEGKLLGVLLGVVIIGLMNNGLILMNVSDYWQMTVRGVILIIALSIDTISTIRNEKNVKGAA
jgi:ribose transport system permease protein